MRSEALDITIEGRGHAVWLLLRGPFNNEQVPGFREKINGLMEDGNKRLVVDLEQVTSVGDQVAQMFVHTASLIRGKGGDIKFVFRNAAVTAAFGTYRNVLDIRPDSRALSRGGLLGLLRYRRAFLSRKTGVRLSRPVAIFLLVALSGWFVSLAFIVRMQNHRIHQQEQEVHELALWKQDALLELQTLRDRLKPMEQLGLLKDAPNPRGKPPPDPALKAARMDKKSAGNSATAKPANASAEEVPAPPAQAVGSEGPEQESAPQGKPASAAATRLEPAVRDSLP